MWKCDNCGDFPRNGAITVKDKYDEYVTVCSTECKDEYFEEDISAIQKEAPWILS